MIGTHEQNYARVMDELKKKLKEVNKNGKERREHAV